MTDNETKPRGKHVDTRFPEKQHERLQEWAAERGITMSAAILTIVADRLDADEVKR